MLLLLASVCEMVAHTLELLLTEWNLTFKIISELNSVRHMTEKSV